MLLCVFFLVEESNQNQPNNIEVIFNCVINSLILKAQLTRGQGGGNYIKLIYVHVNAIIISKKKTKKNKHRNSKKFGGEKI